MVICVMTGRVVPCSPKNVTPGLVINVSRRFELTLLTVTARHPGAVGAGRAAPLVGVLSAVAAVLHAARQWQWPRVTLSVPSCVLHALLRLDAHGLCAAGAGAMGPGGVSLAVHAFAIGVIGGLIISMITRTARPYRAAFAGLARGEVVALRTGAAGRRGARAGATLQPAWYAYAVEAAATCLWAVAFAIYLVIYTFLAHANAPGWPDGWWHFFGFSPTLYLKVEP